jgi:LPXTG-site transpeptidase (sortase) family protein
LLAVASAALFSAGLFTVFSALTEDGIDLPSEGVLEEILRDTADGGAGRSALGAPDAGAGLEGPGPAEPSPTVGSGDPLQTAGTPSPVLSAEPPPPLSPPPPAPVALAIPLLEAAAPVLALGLDADRYPEVPDGPDMVAWHNFTAAPGQSSNAVFAAHYDWVDEFGEGVEGVFYRLSELEIDDTITVTLDDGSELEYRVTGNVAIPYDDPDVLRLMDGTTKDVITLITCGGAWERNAEARYGGNYSHRIIVRAGRVPEAGVGFPAAADSV